MSFVAGIAKYLVYGNIAIEHYLFYYANICLLHSSLSIK